MSIFKLIIDKFICSFFKVMLLLFVQHKNGEYDTVPLFNPVHAAWLSAALACLD